MKIKKLILAAAALAALIAVFAGAWLLTRPPVSQGAKTITVEVVHADQSRKTFTYHTDEEHLGPVLLSNGLIEGENSSFGLFIKTVDGETADFNTNGAYWAVYQGEEYAAQGVDTTPIHDGDSFSLVYTVG